MLCRVNFSITFQFPANTDVKLRDLAFLIYAALFRHLPSLPARHDARIYVCSFLQI